MRRRRALCATGFVIASLWPIPASAGSANATIAVSATVTDSCAVAAAPMAFGKASSGAATDTDAALTLACSPGTAFTVALDDGVNASSGSRRMKGAVRGDYVAYEIYTSSARNERWRQTAGRDTVAGTATNGAATLTAYGRILPGNSSLRADDYRDTVTVTVSF